MKKSPIKITVFFLATILMAYSIITIPENLKSENPTGLSIITKGTTFTKSHDMTYSQLKEAGYGVFTLKIMAEKFFQAEEIIYPKGSCAEISKEFLNDVLHSKIAITEDYTSTGEQRISSMIFGIDQDVAGSLEMVYGDDLVEKENTDCAIKIWTEFIVRLPKIYHTSTTKIRAFGKKTGNVIVITSGEFQTPFFKCSFEMKNNTYAEKNIIKELQ